MAPSWCGGKFQSGPGRGTPLVIPGGKELMMTLMTSTFFYDRKIRIAILTFATFAALC